MRRPTRNSSGWTFAELLAVILLAAVLMLIATLSVYRGKAAADELACQDKMRAIHSMLQVYWEKNGRTYPADQAAFEQFLQNRTYFPEGEPRCPQGEDETLHYLYTYAPTAEPVPGDVVITCPVGDSGHGLL